MHSAPRHVTPLLKMQLSTRHTVGSYYRLLADRDKAGIATLIRVRLGERYISPVQYSKQRNGFATMAMCCLLIETIQCFRDGKNDTNKKGEGVKAFENFFAWDKSPSGFSSVTQDFYSNVRCGILHQGETKNGWRITRKTALPLFDARSKQVNADKFLAAMKSALVAYCGELALLPWTDSQWEKCRGKMKFIIKNCKSKP